MFENFTLEQINELNEFTKNDFEFSLYEVT